MKADLHIHSTVSDGSDSIAQVIAIAKEKGLDAIAITDHDTISHLAQIPPETGLQILGGVELSAVHRSTNTRAHVLGYNMQKPLFQDRRARIALTHLVNRERILDEVHLGLGRIISGPFIPQSPYYNHSVAPLPFSIARAAEILAEAGWEDTDGDGLLDKDYDGSGERKPFQFTLSVPSSSTQIRQIAAIVEQDMLKAKIKVDIKPIEWSVYTQLIDEREFEATCLLWSGGVEGDPYQIWHSSGANRKASSNYVGYDSAEADALIEAGRREMDKRKRYEIYRRLHEVIAADQPYTFLVAPTAVLAQSKRFRNAVVFEGGMSSRLQWIPRALQVDR